ncbi:MAG: hypothetical protein EXQ54_02645 [Acidobacteria bacterium]|nr:hypothetical protein [Acidobacteriota bacterium]
MRFAIVLPWWGYALLFGGALALAWLAYARVPIALTRAMRLSLSGLRAVTLVLLIAILLRPVVLVPPAAARNSLLPVLVDISRSMRLTDGDGVSRLDRARAIVRDLQAQVADEYRIELLTFGEALAPGNVDEMAATARRSDLSGALNDLADRHRRERVAGVIVLSDGGDTSPRERDAVVRMVDAPVLAVGMGRAETSRDREVLNLTAGEPLLAGASIDLSVSAISAGFGTDPVELRISANGRPIEVRRVTPTADGAPIHEVFMVSPTPDSATVYAIEIPAADGELSAENNVRSVLVPAQTGRRKILMVEGAPGYEHTFLKRALAQDPGLDVDAVVRKGQNDDGRDTFYVQAAPGRVAALASGFPAKRSELFVYDAIIFGNIEADFFTREQLELTSAFVAERGGGLLVLGARSFDRQGLSGTPLDQVLPIDLTDRRATIALASSPRDTAPPNSSALTADGARHPATRLAVTTAESRQRWAQLPALASVAPIGGPRPGAQVLVVATGGDGVTQPLIAAQRYGQGRSLVFAGEASWRWRMMRPATDHSYETIWRQLARWITAGSAAPVAIAAMTPTVPGVTERISVTVRNQEFAPVANAEVSLAVTAPNGEARLLTPALSSPQDGRYAVAARFDQPGVYRLDATATRAGVRIGAASRQVLVGGADQEMAQPRLNDAVLKRLAAETSGCYLPADRAGELPALLRESRVDAGVPEPRDLWHNGGSFLALVALLGAEWLLRRRAGLA